MKAELNVPLNSLLGYVDLYPTYLGYEECLPGKTFGPAVRDDYLIHYIVRGRGRFERAGKVYPVRAGEAFLILPNEVTSYSADPEDPWHYVWLHFDGTAARRLADLPSPILPVGTVDLFPLLERAVESRPIELAAISILHTMLSKLFDPPRKTDYVARVVNDIEARYMQDISVASYAADLSLDRRYLSRLFSARLGVSLGQYIINVRIEKAKRLLEEGIPVLKTAELVGYPEYTVFSKLFRKKVGISPRSYAAKKFT